MTDPVGRDDPQVARDVAHEHPQVDTGRGSTTPRSSSRARSRRPSTSAPYPGGLVHPSAASRRPSRPSRPSALAGSAGSGSLATTSAVCGAARHRRPDPSGVQRGVPLQGRERRAQLVRGVGDEPLHPRLGCGVGVDHRVERLAEPGGLGARRPGRHAVGGVARGDGVGGLRHLGDRAAGRAGRPTTAAARRRRRRPARPARASRSGGWSPRRPTSWDGEHGFRLAVRQGRRDHPHATRLTGCRGAPLRCRHLLARAEQRQEEGVALRVSTGVRVPSADIRPHPDVGQAGRGRGGAGRLGAGRGQQDRPAGSAPGPRARRSRRSTRNARCTSTTAAPATRRTTARAPAATTSRRRRVIRVPGRCSRRRGRCGSAWRSTASTLRRSVEMNDSMIADSPAKSYCQTWSRI